MVRDACTDLAEAGLQVAGISPTEQKTKAEFAKQFKLGYPILADPDKKAVKAYGADGPFGLGVRRITYLIGPDGVIRDAIRADLRLSYHAEFLKKALEHARKSSAAAGPGRAH